MQDNAEPKTANTRVLAHESTCRKGRAKSNYPKLLAVRMVGVVGEQ